LTPGNDADPLCLTPRERVVSRVLDNQRRGPSAFELSLERHRLAFLPGQNLVLHGPDATADREYTIASGRHDPALRVLCRLIPNGRLTTQLVKLPRGAALTWSGPYGSFTLRDPGRPLVFVGTGTGISPCRAFLRSFSQIDATVVHGVREESDLFYRREFAGYRYVPCVTRGRSSDVFRGRVTDWLKDAAFSPGAHFYLCGAFDMVHDVTSLLRERGVDPGRIFTEAYYYGQPE
jgi:NAD(P)H-flavin reductase